MRTALIRVVGSAADGFEVRLSLDWDGRTPPGDDCPKAPLGKLPAPPKGCRDLGEFLLTTAGASAEFARIGCGLRDALLAGDVGTELASVRHQPVRVMLDVPTELADMPWELMRTSDERLFTDVKHPIARITASYDPDRELDPLRWPLRVLLVVATKDEKIGVKEEIEHVREGFRGICGVVDLDVLNLPIDEAVRREGPRERIRSALEDARPHVLHFIGHGDSDDERRGYLRLETPQPGGVPWRATDIRDDLADHAPDLAILNACHSGAPNAQTGSQAAARGFELAGVSAIIAMQGPIKGKAAELFSRGFYESLARSEALDIAVAKGRRRITDVAEDDRREYALPKLVLSASPESILDLTPDPRTALPQARLDSALFFVDRVPNRRRLWKRMRGGRGPSPRIFAITGPPQVGKGSLVRWCMAVAILWGHRVAHLDLTGSEGLTSATFLGDLAEALPMDVTDAAPEQVQRFDAELQRHPRSLTRQPARSPQPLYEAFRALLSAGAAQHPLVIGIDAVELVDPYDWREYALPKLIVPIARGMVPNTTLVVALRDLDCAERFPDRLLSRSEVEVIPLDLFSRAEFVELATQWLRAQGYAKTDFGKRVADDEKDLPEVWTVDAFESLRIDARKFGWRREAEPVP